jgi:hypothetical protein
MDGVNEISDGGEMHQLRRLVFAGIAAGLLSSGTANATENGLNIYPVGVNTVLDGLAPDPGQTRFYNYTQYYEASKFAGANGNSSVPGFHVDVAVDAPRVMHTWSPTLGPLTFTSGATFTILHVQTSVMDMKGVRTGFGDTILEPLDINYASADHTLFALFAPSDISIPTGSYSPTRLANPGVNYYGFIPNAGVTWFPRPGWELSAMAALQINTRNKDTDYTSGTIASLEYLVGFNVTKTLQLGVQGFYLQQISDDKVAGQSYKDGFRGSALALGPQVRYEFAPGCGLTFKYQREFDVRNRAEGNRLWLELSFPLN